jgi:(S)-2-hydroxy-acid oxidase
MDLISYVFTLHGIKRRLTPARLRDNEAAIGRYQIRPRILVNVGENSTETEILDTKVSLPFDFSPAASHKLATQMEN